MNEAHAMLLLFTTFDLSAVRRLELTENLPGRYLFTAGSGDPFAEMDRLFMMEEGNEGFHTVLPG